MTLDPSRRHPGRPILCASLAIFRDDKVLLAERRNPPAAGYFSLPGGLVEVGETLEAAALRELMEETGVAGTVEGFTGHVEVIRRDEDGRVERHFVVASFWGEWRSGEGIAGEEASRVIWLPPGEAAILPLTPGLLPLLEKAVTVRAARLR